MSLVDMFTQSMGGARSVDGIRKPLRQPRHQLSQGNQIVKLFSRQQSGSQFGGNELSQDMFHRQALQRQG